jgi:cytochrome o ubiquinol oxidase operon protein cyoD
MVTATSFFVAGTDLVWQPSIPVAPVVLAIAQMGVHLVFFPAHHHRRRQYQ